MRPTIFLACFAISVATASQGNAKEGPGPLGSAWPAPVGHFQPRARDIRPGTSASSSRPEQDAFDRALDDKLKICRGC